MEGEIIQQKLTQVNKYIEQLDYENAKSLLESILQAQPNNTEALDTLSEVLLTLGDTESTIQMVNKSIKLEPNKNGDKYMTIGQLTDSAKGTLKFYEKGVEVFISDLKSANETQKVTIKDSLASAYASIAELHMTTELWYLNIIYYLHIIYSYI